MFEAFRWSVSVALDTAVNFGFDCIHAYVQTGEADKESGGNSWCGPYTCSTCITYLFDQVFN